MRPATPLTFFHDVLCPYCCVVSERLRRLEDEFAGLVEVRLRPFALRPEPAAMSLREVRRQVALTKKASRELDGYGLSPAIWKGIDPPDSTLPPLLAAEAALQQGRHAQRKLLDRMHDAAFRTGLNVTRRDILFELAAACGLDLNQFALAFDSQTTLRAVEAARRQALASGVRAVPTVAIGHSRPWLLSGIRETHEYRDMLVHWLQRDTAPESARVLH